MPLNVLFPFDFWPGLGLPRPKAIVVIRNFISCQNHLQKKTSKSAKYPWPLRYKKRSIEMSMHLGLDNIIKLKFTTNSDRCAILNILNCLTKNFSRNKLIDNWKLVRKQ